MDIMNYERHEDGILIEVESDELYLLRSNTITNGSAVTGMVLDYFREVLSEPIDLDIASDIDFQNEMLEEIANRYRREWERIEP